MTEAGEKLMALHSPKIKIVDGLAKTCLLGAWQKASTAGLTNLALKRATHAESVRECVT